MLSFVTCSRNKDIPALLKQNIADTVGGEHELIVIDNSSGNYSIFQAYNEGVARSKGEILCFMHDDVLFRTNCWGEIIEKHFREDGGLGFHYKWDMGWMNDTLRYVSTDTLYRKYEHNLITFFQIGESIRTSNQI